ncbi:MAG: hypothetical protein Q8O24_04400 [Gallionellaceae bacterium]|nr:hypothetical protein [Gallionellaceae bacterium]
MRKKIFLHPIELHSLAPSKPPLGQPWNGCGVCCATEPCPVAVIFLLQRSGRCRALVWQDERNRYLCGMVAAPHHYSLFIPKLFSRMMGSVFLRRIASGIGCDSEIELED